MKKEENDEKSNCINTICIAIRTDQYYAMTNDELKWEIETIENQMLDLFNAIDYLCGQLNQLEIGTEKSAYVEPTIQVTPTLALKSRTNIRLLTPFEVRYKGYGYYQLSDDNKAIYDNIEDYLYNINERGEIYLTDYVDFSNYRVGEDFAKILTALYNDNEHLMLDDQMNDWKIRYYINPKEVFAMIQYDQMDYWTFIEKIYALDD